MSKKHAVKSIFWLAVGIFGLVLTASAQAATFTVTNTNDSGAGSLRRRGVAISFLLLVLAGTVIWASPAGAQGAGSSSYSVIDLGTLGGGSSQAVGINASGQVVGQATTAANTLRAFLWENGVMTDLGTLSGAVGINESFAFGINDTGQVVGESSAGATGSHSSAFLWADSNNNGQSDPGEMIDLGGLGSNPFSQARGINASGQVVGYALNVIGIQRAFLWADSNNNGQSDPGEMIDLGTLGLPPPGVNFSGTAFGINDTGQVVGEASSASTSSQRAFLWTPAVPNGTSGTMIDLGTLGGSSSQAVGINTSGQVVGQATTAANTFHAFLWADCNNNGQSDPGEMIDLGTMNGGSFSQAFGINASGQVVGLAFSAAFAIHAFLWQNGVMTDLNDLIDPSSGWVLERAFAINDRGQIVGVGSHNGLRRAFLLRPATRLSMIALGLLNQQTVSAQTCTPTEFHWINPNSGDFGTDSNWNPAGVPGIFDTAIFDLSSTAPIVVTAPSVSVARLLNHGMDLELHGSVQVLTGPSPQLGFAVDSGGQLLLSNGATLATQDGSVSGFFSGPASTSSVFVNGAGTQWTIGPSGELDIGFPGRGEVVVVNDGSLNAQKSIKVGDVNAPPSSLRVEFGGLVQTPFVTIEQGSVQVLGQGVNDSKLQVASELNVGGQNGPGSMLLEDGGTVQAQRVFVGDAAGNGGDTITISGVDKGGLPSTLFVTGGTPVSFFSVFGGAGTQVEVKDGGFLTVGTPGQAVIGKKFQVGKVIVHGKAGSTPASWDTFGNVFVGGEIVPSEVIVENGGRVRSFNGQVIVGSSVNELGRITVSGSDSFLSADRLLIVGNDGHGELTIADGARVQSAAGAVGQSSQIGPAVGSGSVTIAGSLLFPSEWHVTGDCFVGSDEPGSVTLDGGLGPFSVGGAILRVDGTLTVGPRGLINGFGRLATSHRVVNGGFILPGLSPGMIEIEGDYEQTANGVLTMEAAGLNDGQFDVLHVTGNTSLGGTLDVRFLNGYLPKTGDVIPFLKLDGTVTGDFAQIIFPQLAPGFQFKTEIVNGSYQLTALNDAVLAPTLPTLSINNVIANEGNAGTTPFDFTVTLSAASASTVTVDFATADGTATAGSDYAAASGTLTFTPGQTSKTITVNVNGDTTVEPNETFFVNLSSPTNATIAVAQGTGTITNDDAPPLPTLSINNVTASEGNSGTTPFDFTVTLSAASASTVTVNFATADGTATAGSDYAATSGTLTFTPGQTSKTITVNVNGDTAVEPNETFFVNLSGATNATIAVAQGTGTITNDDAPPPIHDHFLCYQVKLPKKPKFVPRDVTLDDQFETGSFHVIKPFDLCLPADKNGEGINDPNTHLESYQITPTSPPVKETNITVTNQFGTIVVDTVVPDRLLVPTAKSLTGPVDPPDPDTHNVDHYKCYTVINHKGSPKFTPILGVTVEDQFTDPAKFFNLTQPTRLCTPVDKNGEGVKDETAHLMCYLANPAKGQPERQPVSGINLNNQFGPERLSTAREDELCVPSTKTLH